MSNIIPSVWRDRAGFVIAIASVTLMMAGASAPSPFYPVLQESLGLAPVALTIVFAVYAIALLIALLVLGSLSDHLGRRPVISVGFGLLAVSVFAFWHADTLTILIIARALQGVASGILLAALSAMIADFETAVPGNSGTAWNAIAPMVGLAVGALASGVVLDFVELPMQWVFLSSTVIYAALAAVIWIAPETSEMRQGWMRSLQPRASIPPAAGRSFAISVPAVFAGWATGGLFLSLGASIMHNSLHLDGHTWQGLVVTALAGSGAVAAAAMHSRSARTITVFGTSALALGTLISLIALTIPSTPLYLAAVIIAGAGFGTAFMGVLRTIGPQVSAEERAGTFAAVYVVAYVAFGVPAVIAGVLAPIISLTQTTLLYGACVVVLAAAATVMRARTAA
jgi:hypothetical protein